MKELPKKLKECYNNLEIIEEKHDLKRKFEEKPPANLPCDECPLKYENLKQLNLHIITKHTVDLNPQNKRIKTIISGSTPSYTISKVASASKLKITLGRTVEKEVRKSLTNILTENNNLEMEDTLINNNNVTLEEENVDRYIYDVFK